MHRQQHLHLSDGAGGYDTAQDAWGDDVEPQVTDSDGMLEFTGLDEVWFVVSPQNPLKKKDSLLDNYQRLHMINLAIGTNDKLKASDIEFHLPVPSYTIDTLTYLGLFCSLHKDSKAVRDSFL